MQLNFVLGLILVLLVSCLNFSISESNRNLYSNTWAVQIEGGSEEADRIATTHGYTNLGPLGSLEGFYLFRHDSHPRRSRRNVDETTKRLLQETYVTFAEQQVIKRRVKRGYNPKLNDPLFNKQWFIHNTYAAPFTGYDHNILPVWQEGVFGKGIVVSILDDGIEYTHKDLSQNYDALASYDFNSNDKDPMPRQTWTDENRHGTRCAGEVAAQFNNSKCTAGVAPLSRIGGVRMLDGDVTDAVEASSLSLQPQHIQIYSASWGPDDDGRTVDGPARLARKAFTDGIEKGRGGLGSIYVWASGNGGREQDNCNCDGYTNSIYTLSISSATEHGKSPWYSESCSSTLATAFSSGTWGDRKIVTTDLHNGCTSSHTGTSASAPLAAGILALALEVNRNLTWRDMQHLVIRTSSMEKLGHDWESITNGVGRRVDHKFGYGLLEAHALVKLARRWITVPQQKVCLEIPSDKAIYIQGGGSLTVTNHATGCMGSDRQIRYLEHVECIITLETNRRGAISIYLTSPRGTRSTLLGKRPRDNSRNGFQSWAFMTTHSWEENPVGTWTLEIINGQASTKRSLLKTWELRFYGTYDHPSPDEARQKQPVQACDIECDALGCTGPQADQCHVCKHFKKNITGECVPSCGSDDYTDDAAKQCRTCSFTCASCQGPASTDCLTCHPPLLLYNGKCINICPAGLYKAADSTCRKCDQSCKTCAGSAAQCTDCLNGYHLVNSKCVQKCASGEFLDSSTCTKCHPSCKECSKAGHLGCTKCGDRAVGGVPSKLYLSSGECKHSCPAGSHPDDGSQECLKCDASCSSCTGGEKNKCTACSSGLSRVGSPQGTCSQSCPKGHVSSHGICIPCTSSCASCSPSTPAKCTSCSDGEYLHNYACFTADKCPKGTYANSKDQTCDSCDDTCATCTGSADHQCTACSAGYHLLSSKCVLQCPAKTFQSNDGSCQPCPSTCDTCYGVNTTNCLSCVSSHVLYGTQCVSKCPNDTYHDQAKQQCLSCHPTCASCNGTSSSSCLSCKAPMHFKGSACVLSCPEGTFPFKNGCKNCHKSCLSCSGPSDRECSGCKGIKFLDIVTGACLYQCSNGYYGETASALCKPCQAGCKRCTEAGECTDCMPGLIQHQKSCKTHCPTGTYHDMEKTTCKKCDSSCQECAGRPQNCIACSDHLVLSGNKCINICPKGTYLVKGTKHCKTCHQSCTECTGPGHDRCIKCDGGLVKVWSRCVDKCPPAYYYNARDEQCEPCDYYCQTCDGGNGLKNCSKCTPPFVLNDHYCVRECAKVGRYYDHLNHECGKCHSSCSRCIGATANDCITCADPRKVLVRFTCMANCTTGQFKNLQTGLCENCHPTCSECAASGPTKCGKCATGLILSASEGKCKSSCQVGQYKDGNICKNCDASCRTCNGPTEKHCLSCASDQAYYKRTCTSSCPSGTFLSASNTPQLRRCMPCHAICKTCTGLSADTCTSCKTPLYLQKSSCVLQCSSRFVTDAASNVCNPCSTSCPDAPGRPRNRSVQDPSIEALRKILADPSKSRVLPFAIISVVACVALFFVIFGALQFRSAGGMCWRSRYVKLNADFLDEDEDEMGLMEDEDDYDDTA